MIQSTYPESIEESGKYLRMVLQNIAKYKIPYNPISYLLWYEYATGRNEQLIKDIELFLEKDKPLTMSIINEIVGTNLVDEHILLAEKKVKEFQKILVKMAQHLSKSNNKIDTQSNILETCATELSQAKSLDSITGITKRIVLETQSIVESSKTLKGRLNSAVSEIDTLSKELIGVKQDAKTDMLTGLLNRRGFDQAMSTVLESIKTTSEPISFIMLDIDYFKKVNDTYGHLIGDNVLKMLGKLFKDHIKGKDIAARFGGEEFLLTLPQTSLEGAYIVAEQIRVNLQKMTWKIKDTGKSMGQITISAGIAMLKDGESIEDTIKRADEALYHAKNTGRNKTATELDIGEK